MFRPVATLMCILATAAGGAGCELTLDDDLAVTADALTVPPVGEAATLDVASWNIEWFGSTGNGPSNEDRQLQNVRDVIAGSDLELWGVAEITSAARFDLLLAQLPGYAGFLASAPFVTGGSGSYAAGEQKVGLIYRKSAVQIVGARVILGSSDHDFAGRPPLEVELRVTVSGRTEELVVVVLHAKASDADASYQRRRRAATALKGHLDAAHPDARVLVIGDFNDDIDESIAPGRPSPYRDFVRDVARWSFPTAALTAAGQSSTVAYDDMIDHHLASNEMAARLAGDAEILPLDASIPSYGATTSDHFPVLSRYVW